MRALSQQGGCRDIEANIVQSEICAVAVADVDTVDSHAEWHDSTKAAHRNSKIRTARCPRDLSFQPALAELRLKQAENRNKEKEYGRERDAEPAKDLSRILHQKACPRLM
jgi:hypothetical protein